MENVPFKNNITVLKHSGEHPNVMVLWRHNIPIYYFTAFVICIMYYNIILFIIYIKEQFYQPMLKWNTIIQYYGNYYPISQLSIYWSTLSVNKTIILQLQ